MVADCLSNFPSISFASFHRIVQIDTSISILIDADGQDVKMGILWLKLGIEAGGLHCALNRVIAVKCRHAHFVITGNSLYFLAFVNHAVSLGFADCSGPRHAFYG